MKKKMEAIPAAPLNDNEKFLRGKFYESVAAQSDLMDKLAERLLTLELAIPGAYATVLKLIRGEKAVVEIGWALGLAFLLWAAALALTLRALTPKDWTVNVSYLKQDPKKFDKEGLGIEDFFAQSARYKKKWLNLSIAAFFAGVVLAALAL